MNGRGVPPPLLRLPPEQAGAARLLARLEARHPGVTILVPHRPGEPWRADIDPGAVPGDDRAMILASATPGELLAKVEALFPRPG